MAGFLDKLSDVINNTADEITDKAKEISKFLPLTARFVIRKTIERCYNEIGKLYYEAHKDDTDAFLEQIERITKAKQEVNVLKKDVENIKQIVTIQDASPPHSHFKHFVFFSRSLTRLKMLICGGDPE
ncbi:MAG: hypothetical protein ACLUGF_12960 [Clostridium sp.]